MKRLRHILLTASLLAIGTAANAQADFEITPSAACAGEVVEIKNTTQGAFQLAKFEFGDGLDAYGNNLQHIYASGGTYVVGLTVLQNDGTWSSPNMKQITVSEKPEVEAIHNEKQGLISVTASEGASLKWYCNDVEMKTTAAALYYKESGEYKVVAYYSNGCKDSTSLQVVYKDMEGKDFSSIKVLNNVITPAVLDGINDNLAIEGLPFEGPCEVTVFNSKGKMVYENKNYTNTDGFAGLDDKGNELPAGTYYYVIKSWGRRGCTGFVDIIR